MGVQRQEIKKDDDKDKPPAPNQPPPPSGPAAKYYQAKPGFANFYFNKQERDRLLAGFKKHGDFTNMTGTWSITTSGKINDKDNTFTASIEDLKEGGTLRTLVKAKVGGLDMPVLEPLKTPPPEVSELKEPPNSGGLMLALYEYRTLLTLGEKGFVTDFSHGGVEPFYVPTGEAGKREKVMAEVLRTKASGVAAKWYFSQKDQSLLGFEVAPDSEDDPCEVYLSDYKKVDGRDLPQRIEVHYGDRTYAVLNMSGDGFQIAAAK
jgi:hypothetical protein